MLPTPVPEEEDTGAEDQSEEAQPLITGQQESPDIVSQAANTNVKETPPHSPQKSRRSARQQNKPKWHEDYVMK